MVLRTTWTVRLSRCVSLLFWRWARIPAQLRVISAMSSSQMARCGARAPRKRAHSMGVLSALRARQRGSWSTHPPRGNDGGDLMQTTCWTQSSALIQVSVRAAESRIRSDAAVISEGGAAHTFRRRMQSGVLFCFSGRSLGQRTGLWRAREFRRTYSPRAGSLPTRGSFVSINGGSVCATPDTVPTCFGSRRRGGNACASVPAWKCRRLKQLAKPIVRARRWPVRRRRRLGQLRRSSRSRTLVVSSRSFLLLRAVVHVANPLGTFARQRV